MSSPTAELIGRLESFRQQERRAAWQGKADLDELIEGKRVGGLLTAASASSARTPTVAFLVRVIVVVLVRVVVLGFVQPFEVVITVPTALLVLQGSAPA